MWLVGREPSVCLCSVLLQHEAFTWDLVRTGKTSCGAFRVRALETFSSFLLLLVSSVSIISEEPSCFLLHTCIKYYSRASVVSKDGVT